jgi:chaperonin GroEL (HSP60 family)
MNAFIDEEERMLRQMVDKIKSVGANVVFCQKGIDDLVQHFLAKEKIYAARRVKKGDMEKLSKAVGATIISKINELDVGDLGKANLVEVRKIQDEEMTFVTGCNNPKAISILIRGGTDHVVAEIERSLDDAMSVVAVAIEDGRMLTGGGSTAVEVALRLR